MKFWMKAASACSTASVSLESEEDEDEPSLELVEEVDIPAEESALRTVSDKVLPWPVWQEDENWAELSVLALVPDPFWLCDS